MRGQTGNFTDFTVKFQSALPKTVKNDERKSGEKGRGKPNFLAAARLYPMKRAHCSFPLRFLRKKYTVPVPIARAETPRSTAQRTRSFSSPVTGVVDQRA